MERIGLSILWLNSTFFHHLKPLFAFHSAFAPNICSLISDNRFCFIVLWYRIDSSPLWMHSRAVLYTFEGFRKQWEAHFDRVTYAYGFLNVKKKTHFHFRVLCHFWWTSRDRMQNPNLWCSAFICVQLRNIYWLELWGKTHVPVHRGKLSQTTLFSFLINRVFVFHFLEVSPNLSCCHYTRNLLAVIVYKALTAPFLLLRVNFDCSYQLFPFKRSGHR